MNTIKEQDPHISCISTTRTKRGRHISTNYFDMPDAEYGEGFLAGAAIAHELIREMQNTSLRRLNLVMQEATRHIDYKEGSPPSKRGAACGLYFTVLRCLEFASKRMDLEQFALMTVHDCNISHARVAVREKAEKSLFVERMANARNAKRTAQILEVAHAY